MYSCEDRGDKLEDVDPGMCWTLKYSTVRSLCQDTSEDWEEGRGEATDDEEGGAGRRAGPGRGQAKTSSVSERDRKIGHRRINEEGQVRSIRLISQQAC